MPTLSHHSAAAGLTVGRHRLPIEPDRALLVAYGLFPGEGAVGEDQLEQQRVTFPVDGTLVHISFRTTSEKEADSF